MPPAGTCETCGNLESCDMTIMWDSLTSSASDGCTACQMLKDGICGLTESDQTPTKLELVSDMSLFVYAVRDDRKDSAEIFEFYTLPGQPAIWPSLGPARTVSTDSSSDDCISLAARWLKGCLTSHSACRRKGVPTLPTRVIDVGSSDADVRLVVNSNGMQAEYVALSHCWGLSHPLTLTGEKLADMQQKIVLEDNSRTFRDAVDVTRRLGIKYLWIDSLTIVQDDLSDWEAEAPKMSDVYNFATVTISAASSMDTSGGLFPKEEDRRAKHKSITLACSSPNGEQSTIHVRTRNTEHFDISDNAHASVSPEEPRLRTRGWVLQEDFLSPRMLHFRKEELTWTCSTYSRCECRIPPSMPLPHPFRAESGTIEKSEAYTASLNLQWPAIIMEYTRRSLTKQSDRVAALSGLANYMESQTTDTYYCGIWYEDMSFQLLWYVDREDCPQGVPARFETPYAQSWSWMSIPGPISYYERHPVGIAPSHPAVRSKDAIEAFLKVINVGRLPFDWNNMVGKVKLCPAALVGLAIRVAYIPVTKTWETLDPVKDFDPANLRVSIDTLEDEASLNCDTRYVMILAGRWVGQGMTFLPMQAVCILARELPPEREHLVTAAVLFQISMAEQLGGIYDLEDMILPRPEHSFERIGLVRGAGSIEAWKNEVPAQVLFLF